MLLLLFVLVVAGSRGRAHIFFTDSLCLLACSAIAQTRAASRAEEPYSVCRELNFFKQGNTKPRLNFFTTPPARGRTLPFRELERFVESTMRIWC